MSENVETQSVPETEKTHSALSRVLNLSIFFVGIGAFAAIGFVLRRIALFSDHAITYFSVGAAVGLVGLLLWVVTR